MAPDHPALAAHDILVHGGWPSRYARVLAVASDEDYGFAVVDGNGDGAELEAETWIWDGEKWTAADSCGAGSLDELGPVQTGGHIGDAYFAYGSAPGRQSITINFDSRFYQVPVSNLGVWAFVKISTSPGSPESPTLTA